MHVKLISDENLSIQYSCDMNNASIINSDRSLPVVTLQVPAEQNKNRKMNVDGYRLRCAAEN